MNDVTPPLTFIFICPVIAVFDGPGIKFTLLNLTLFFTAFLATQFIFQAFSQKVFSTDFTFSYVKSGG